MGDQWHREVDGDFSTGDNTGKMYWKVIALEDTEGVRICDDSEGLNYTFWSFLYCKHNH